MNFGTTFYYISTNRQINPFEKKIEELIDRLELYKKQFNLTSKSYLKEWSNEKEELNENIKEQKIKAEKLYKEIYDSVVGEEYAQSIALQNSGLEDIDYHEYERKEEIDSKYKDFLDFYAKSILTSLYSLNESKLNEICIVGSEVFEKKIKPHHFNERDYLKSSLTYLELVLEISTESLDPYFSKLKEIQFIRNKIVHEDSKFQDEKINEIASKYSSLQLEKSTGYLKIIKSDFIELVFDLISDFYEELVWLFEKKQNYQVTKNGLKYWFGVLDKEIEIEKLQFDEIKKGKRFEFELNSKKFGLFNVKLTIKKSSKPTNSIINQRDEQHFQKFVKDQENYFYNLIEAYSIFDLKNEGRDYELMIY
ncbi:hypothetical protein INR75_11325 [Zunongwangia sp. SCSIO 43204]|uniref:hypothetical protein n=1 Tax=Zunongwangia sp. SCSIO 43204 TaxID=2779359 RepID=UPI001CAA1366|nr:hypothetical protein [Zunongwangia sp. SCSIO 43204]UAB82826.1 hypothetical protein INR75_11325 [Zunongwangia sp. SCSIO 43204]